MITWPIIERTTQPSDFVGKILAAPSVAADIRWEGVVKKGFYLI